MAAVDTNIAAFQPYPLNGYDNNGALVPWTLVGGTIYFTRNNVYFPGTTGGIGGSGTISAISLHHNTLTGLYSKNSATGPWETFAEVMSYVATATGKYPETTQELTQVFNFGLGDLVVEDIRLGQTKIEQYSGVTTTTALFQPDKTVMGADFAHPNPPYGLESWRLNVITVEGGELRQNVEVHDSGWVTRDFYGDDCEFIQVDISGRLYYSGNNGPEASTCNFEIEYRPEGSGGWTQVYAPSLVNADAFPMRETYGWSVPLGTPYEVRVRKTTADTTDARLTQDFECPQIKFFRPEPAEANNPFTQHPAQNRYAIAVRAGGQINGTIDNLNGYGHSKCWVWTGGTATPPTIPVGAAGWSWTTNENPAWWYLYYAMGGFRRSASDAGSPLNGKGWCMGPEKADGPRMFGAGLRTERIDLEALSAWAAFCNAYNLRFNAVIREQSNVAEVLTRIARIGRGSPTWQNGKLGAVWEDPADVPVAAFGVSSIVAGSMTIGYIGYNSPDEIVASYTNPNDDWKEDEVRKTVPGVVLPNSEANISLFGCKYKEQATREVNLLAARQFYQRRRVTFNTSQEGLPIVRGDVILLAHDMTNWAFTSRCGDATAGSSLAMVRRFEPMTDFPNINVLVVKPDGTMLTGTAAMPAEETHLLALNGGWAPVDFNEFPDAVPEDWVVHLSTDTEVGKRMRVVATEPGDGRNLLITCTDERPEMYLYENSGTPTTVDPSEEELVMKVIGLSVNRESCSESVVVRWENINCRLVTLGISINGGTVGYANVVGEQLFLGVLPPGTTIAVNVMPVADPGTQSIGSSTGESIAIETDEINPTNSCLVPSVVSTSELLASLYEGFYGTITLANATSATVTNLPAGLSQSGAVGVDGYVITITGSSSVLGATALLIDAANVCDNDLIPSFVTGLSAGTFVVSANCALPQVGQISVLSATVGTTYNSGLLVLNATFATITNLPVGLSQSGTANVNGNYLIQVTGKPQGSQVAQLLVNATNACADGRVPNSVTAQDGGTLTITGGVAGECLEPTTSWWSPPPSGKVGQEFTGTLLLLNATAGTINNLPPGMNQSSAPVADGNAVITVIGTPTVAGTYAMTVDAENACGGSNSTAYAYGLSTGNFAVAELPVNCPTPYAGGSTGGSAYIGEYFTSRITVINATSATITNLPTWLSQSFAFNNATSSYQITLTGTPPQTESQLLLLMDATNDCGGGSNTSYATGVGALNLSVIQPIVCQSPIVGQLTSLTGQVGVPYSASVTIQYATTAAMQALPAGLTSTRVSNGNGFVFNVSGTPTTAGTTTVRVDAINSCNGGATEAQVFNRSVGNIVISA